MTELMILRGTRTPPRPRAAFRQPDDPSWLVWLCFRRLSRRFGISKRPLGLCPKYYVRELDVTPRSCRPPAGGAQGMTKWFDYEISLLSSRADQIRFARCHSSLLCRGKLSSMAKLTNSAMPSVKARNIASAPHRPQSQRKIGAL
jgi:hypothetical protein